MVRTGCDCFVVSVIFLAAWASPRPANGQSVPDVGKGNIEAGVFAGESYGLDRFRPMAGGNVAYGLSPRLFPFLEASYLPGVLREAVASNGTVVASEHGKFNMTDFHGGLHIRLLRPESRIVPYLVAGLGLIHESQGTLPQCLTVGTTTECGPGFTVPSSTLFAVNFGGGLRFFFSEHFALRLEFKAFQPTGEVATISGNGEKVGDHIFYRFAIGPVFQFR
jgi:hypothetical protein